MPDFLTEAMEMKGDIKVGQRPICAPHNERSGNQLTPTPRSQVLIPTGFPQILQKAFFFFFFAALSLHCYMGTFSSCGEQGPLSRCSAQASHCGAFSSCREQALEPRFRNCGSRAQLLRGMGSFWTRD